MVHPSIRMRDEIVAILILLVVASAGAGYFIGHANEHAITTTVNEPPPNSYIATNAVCASSADAGHGPCLGSPAYVFNSCPNLLSGPPAPYTCTFRVTDTVPPYPSYTINITLGDFDQSGEPYWANCFVSGNIGYADCIPVINSTDFVVGVYSTIS